MSKKAVRSRDSFVKNWTAAIAGSFLLVSAQAAQAGQGNQAFRDFRANNPDLSGREVREQFREQRLVRPAVDRGPVIAPLSNVSVSVSHADQVRADRLAARAERLNDRADRLNSIVRQQSMQVNDNGNLVNVRQGINLDLTSQIRNITLGERLFGSVSSIEIQVGGEKKALTAGAQVTAAEYIAAKQVLAGVGQKVTIDNAGSATGGDVDLSAITGRGDVMRASDLTVPVNVTATGDFSRGSEFRLLGDLTNSGVVHATNTGGRNGGTIAGDDILNNAGALISSDVDLKLDSNTLVNNGEITSNGNLTITASDVTNSGRISSRQDVNLTGSADKALNVNNAGGTIAARNAINVRTADYAGTSDTTLSGGDYLSNSLNLHAGAGTVRGGVGKVDGVVNSDGYAVHFNSQTDTLSLGSIDLIDPTFYNIGNIDFTASVNVAADLTVIASGNITESVVGAFNINTTTALDGGNLTMIAGANITGASPATPSTTLPTANPGSDVTFNGGSIGGGSILLGNAAMNTSGTAGGKGGNVLLAAFGGFTAGSGVVNLANGGTTTGPSIVTSGGAGASNGDVTIIALNGIDVNAGGVGTINTSGATVGGDVVMETAQPVSTGPVTYLANGKLAPGSATLTSGALGTGVIDVNTINANGVVSILSGGNLSVGNVSSTSSSIDLSAGDLNTLSVVGASLAINGNLTANTGIVLSANNDITQANNTAISGQSISIDAGSTNPSAPAGGDFIQNGSLTVTSGGVIVNVGDSYTLGNGAGDAINSGGAVVITFANQVADGTFTANAPITSGYLIDISGTGNISLAAGAADLTATTLIELSGANISSVANANITSDLYIYLDSNTSNGGDFDMAGGLILTSPATGVISLYQSGTQTADISDNDFTGGIVADNIQLFNFTTGGTIQFLNNSTPINFVNVMAQADSDVTVYEPTGSGRDGNINFVASSSGGTFTVLADNDITTLDAGFLGLGSISGKTVSLRSQNGNIGSVANAARVTADLLRIQALGAPSLTSGNAFVVETDGITFGAGDSQVTGVLDATATSGDITTDGTTIVRADTALLNANNGSIGSDLLNPFRIDAGSGVGSGVSAVASGGVFIFEQNAAAIDAGNPSSAGGAFSFVAGGNLDVRQNISGQSVLLDSKVTIALGAGVQVNGITSVELDASGNITSALGSHVTTDALSVSIGGSGVLNTSAKSLRTFGGTGSLTVNEDDGITLLDQANLTNLSVYAGNVAKGDIQTSTNFTVGTLLLQNSDGNVVVDNVLTGTTSVTVDTFAGDGSITGAGGLVSPAITLLSGAGLINTDVNGLSDGDTTVVAEAAGGGTVFVDYQGTGTMTLGLSAGNKDFTAQSSNNAGKIKIGGDISGTGSLELNTNNLSFAAPGYSLSFADILVQSNLASSLTVDGGTGSGTFNTTDGGAGTTFLATAGSLTTNGLLNFNGGDVFMTLGDNSGTNAFVNNGTLNGDGTPPGPDPNANALTISARIVTLGTITNFSSVAVIRANTIVNTNGDVVLPNNLIFSGQNLAILASGNITATGAVLIDLSSSTTDGGNLTVYAGVEMTTTPPLVGQQMTAQPITITGFSSTGGNVDLGGVNIITSSSFAGGTAGNVTIMAAGSSATTNAGTVVVGNISAIGDTVGGTVAAGGFAGVTVGDITTTGGVVSGNILLGVGTAVLINGPIVVTDGTPSGGFFSPDQLAAGNLNYGNLIFGGGEAALAGAFSAGDLINGGTVTGNELSVYMGAGTATINSNINQIEVDAQTASGGSLTVTDSADLLLTSVKSADLDLQVDVANNLTIPAGFIVDVGTGTVGLSANNIVSGSSTSKIIADSLTVDVDGTGVVNTDVNSLSTSLGKGSLTVNEDSGLTLNSQAALTNLVVNAGLVSAGDVTTNSDFSVGTLAITNKSGDVLINHNVTGTSKITLDTTVGGGDITGFGTLITPSATLLASSGFILLDVNGIGGLSTAVTAQSSGGNDVFLDYLGTGTITLGASAGNDDFAVIGSNGGSITIGGNIAGSGDMSLTANTVSFSGAAKYAVSFDSVSVQSLAGSGLTVNGGINGGTFNTTDDGAGVTFTATNKNLITNNKLNFNGGDVFVTLADDDGINAFVNNGNLNGDGTPPGPDPSANEITITAGVMTLGSITNFSAVNINPTASGNTIVNPTGDIILPSNLNFQGQNLAIIAFGNVTASGPITIDLSSATVNGGNLYVLAGYTTSGATGGQQSTADPISVTGFSSDGGNVNFVGVNIITSSTAVGGNAGTVTILAHSGDGFTNAGNVFVGNITAEGNNAGGLVAVAGFGDVSVGDISTIGTTGADGSVILGVGNAATVGSPVFTNGSLSGGAFAPGQVSAGYLLFETINAGTGDVDLAGALNAADIISGDTITADALRFTVGAGSAAASGDFNRVTVDATLAAGGSVTVTEANDIIVDDVAGSDLDLNISTTGDISIVGAIAVGNGIVTLAADDVIQNLGSLSANSLALDVANASLTTSITNLLASTGDNITINNTGNLGINTLTVTGDLTINNDGNTVVAGAITSNNSFVTIDSGGTLTVAAGAPISAALGLNLLADDGLTLNANASTADGAMQIITAAGNLTIAADVDILGDDSILIQAVSTTGVLNIGANASIVTDAKQTGQGDVTILQGAAPTRTRGLRGRNLVVVNNGGTVLTGRGKGSRRFTALAPVNTLTAQGADVLINGSSKAGLVLGGGVVITADPPVAAGTPIYIFDGSAPRADISVSSSQAIQNAPSILAPINTIATLTSAPSINLNNTLDNTLSNLATANTNLSGLAQQEDDSVMVGYAPVGEMVDGNVCSDMEFGFTSGARGNGNGVATMKHSDTVTLENGSALFVPSQAMTIVTPKGSVKLAANSVAFVNVDSNQLSVYDINDHRKSSVVVTAGGRDMALSPGRHLVVTSGEANSFAEVNPIESIMHRSVNRHELTGGKRVFVTEFSIPSAVSVVKPLKAIMGSNHVAAKRVADRVLKTSAVVMMVGGQTPFEFHAKPRTVALNWK